MAIAGQVHGRNAVLYVDDNLGTCRNVSGDLNSIVLSWLRDNPDVTTMANDSHQRIPGLRDVTLTGAYVYNTTPSTGAPRVFDTLLTGSAITRIQYVPGGSQTGCPLYTACMLLNSHVHTAGVNAPIVGTFAFSLASGSLTAGSAV